MVYDSISSNNDAWEGKPFEAIEDARDRAADLREDHQFAAGHKEMLSAYIGSMGDIMTGGVPTLNLFRRRATLLWWAMLAEYHALALRAFHSKALDYNQINVLVSWLSATGKYLPWRQSKACKYADRGLFLVRSGNDVLPHDKALALVMSAKTLSECKNSAQTDRELAMIALEFALGHEVFICNEPDRMLALRQLVRIHRIAGEVYANYGERRLAHHQLSIALRLAEGEANTPSQASKIKKYMLSRKWPILAS